MLLYLLLLQIANVYPAIDAINLCKHGATHHSSQTQKANFFQCFGVLNFESAQKIHKIGQQSEFRAVKLVDDSNFI